MRLISTRDPQESALFREAIFQGLSPDGGLYLPALYPDMTRTFGSLKPDTPFLDTATQIAVELLSDELPAQKIEELCASAFPFEPVFVRVEENLSILELYHGPSFAFKDFGASFLAAAMEAFLENENRQAVILTATSGDTGSAVAQAFKGKDSINVVILYPSGRVSPLQEQQLTTVGGNVHALEVLGTFDDCQRMVKEAFLDPKLKHDLPLTSANSINIGRLLPQAFYYVYGRTRFDESTPVRFCVPSGNFGNLTAGVLTWKWGLKTDGFIAATNVNDVVPEYLRSKVFTSRSSTQTYSNAMDVGNPSNFERLLTMFDNDWKAMTKLIDGASISDTETLGEMQAVKKRTGRILDPHTAVGYLAAERFLESRNDTAKPQIITLSTAHPAKFREVVAEACGQAPELPGMLAEVMNKQKVSTVIGNNLEDLGSFLRDSL
ncbi:MAG: threonine synthase [Spirochaetales bacterium]|jgi:threonine synthase|nr:threonine synthase [Spirochaetales bacterium]